MSVLRLLVASSAFLLLSSFTSAQSIIYMDYTSGFNTTLPNAMVSAVPEHTYTTGGAGSYRFGVDWNNDATDQFTITIPSTFVTVTAENDVAFCTPSTTTNPPNQITFTMTSPHQCNYTVSWVGSFNAILTVTYNGGPNTGNARSDAISTIFVPSSIHGDPQFVGLRGQSYQVHGIDGAVYNLLSDDNLQVNSRFVFLSDGQCPIIDGVADTNCWSHPGSYMGEVSFQQKVDGKLHSALITAGPAQQGFAGVTVDDQSLQVGDRVAFGSFTVELQSAYVVLVTSEQFAFTLSNSDRFLNQGLRSKVGLSKLRCHGLIGQTHVARKYNSPLKVIEGRVDDYAIADDDIFGTDFMYNRFSA